ncbi:multiheme c-type cytochrome [Tropicimonas marinistellae]|uniref:multiheme c-type cytochrome n=1 Tax=Tropicimonas marinistellae TaxID=1739787 RepID=UPI00082A6DA9|nr:multiheme c-type cytochrome [Tropicimonas marinistellae]
MARDGSRLGAAFLGSLAVLLTLATVASGQQSDAAPETGDAESPTYVGSDSCFDCHAAETDDWTGSHHDLAWTEPTPDTVLGDFADADFTHRGETTQFTREGDTYYIESLGADGQPTRWPVAGVIGIAPLQQYFVETEPGRQQSFDIPWDTVEKRWYHMYPDDHLPPGDGFHWTGPYKTWNSRCAECHATDYTRNYDTAERRYASTYSEIGVGCEACHGPGSAHLEWAAMEESGGNYSPAPGMSAMGLTIDFSRGDPETEIQQCASCHARRGPLLDGTPVPGTPFHESYRLSTLRAPLYHADGQIRDEVYVYGSFLQSKMYEKGVTCSDCHDVHSAEHHAEGNGVCLTCHSPAGNPDFPSLKLAEYDTPDHHFHPVDSDGAQCVSCHMIERVYMGIDGRHDHSFRVPRPDLSIATGAPNACTDCHAAEGPYWAQEELEKRFPDSAHRGPHFATAFAAAQQGLPDASENLADIAEAASLPAIVRATALELLLPEASPELAGRLARLLEDPDPMVRANAIPLQRAAPPTDMVTRLLPRLEDASRVVRIAAAREMLAAPVARLPDRHAAALDTAMGEWQASLSATSDFPETQLVLGGIALTTRNPEGALAAFREAVRMDPQLVPAWSMIVRLKAAMGDEAGARKSLDRALRNVPDDPGLAALAAQFP